MLGGVGRRAAAEVDTGPVRSVPPKVTEVMKTNSQEVYNANILLTKRVQQNELGLVFGVPASKLCCASFSFRLEWRVCEDFVAGRVGRFILIHNEVSHDKFG